MGNKRRHRGEGSIIQLEDGRWRGRLSLGIRDGHRERKVFYGDTKQDVLSQMREHQTKIDLKTGVPSSMPVGKWLDTWIGDKKRAKARGTVCTYTRLLNTHIRPQIEKLTMADLNADHIRQIYDRMEDSGVPKVTQYHVSVALKGMLKKAVPKLIPQSPADDVESPKRPRTEARALSRSQVADLLAAADKTRYAALYRLGIDSGARQGELFGLHWPEVDLDGCTIFIRQSLEDADGQMAMKDTKTLKSRRRVRITEGTAAALRGHRSAMEKEGHDVAQGPVFVTLQGKWINASNFIQRVHKPVCRAAGLEGWCFKDVTRHTCATLLLLAGVTPKLVAERLGHSDIVMTLRTYGHLLPDMQSAAIGHLDSILNCSSQTNGHQMATKPETPIVVSDCLS